MDAWQVYEYEGIDAGEILPGTSGSCHSARSRGRRGHFLALGAGRLACATGLSRVSRHCCLDAARETKSGGSHDQPKSRVAFRLV